MAAALKPVTFVQEIFVVIASVPKRLLRVPVPIVFQFWVKQGWVMDVCMAKLVLPDRADPRRACVFESFRLLSIFDFTPS
jgi:hypothetical protein